MFYGFFSKTEAVRSDSLVRFDSLHFVSFPCVAFNMCFDGRTHSTIRLSDWGSNTHTHIRWWSDRRVKTTNDKRINSRLICYLFRNCRFECNKIYAVSARARIHWMGIKQSEKNKKKINGNNENGDDDVGQIYIYLFYCWDQRAGAQKRDVWLLTNIYGPVFGRTQHNWLVTTQHPVVFLRHEDLDVMLAISSACWRTHFSSESDKSHMKRISNCLTPIAHGAHFIFTIRLDRLNYSQWLKWI